MCLCGRNGCIVLAIIVTGLLVVFVSGKEASIVLTDPVHPQHTTVETLVSFHFLLKLVFPQTGGLLAVVGEGQ